jgi:hypothetical protein
MTLDLAVIDSLTGGQIGTIDVACPICGPERRSPVNQRRRVLRIWRIDPNFATFSCARCGEHGYVRSDHHVDVDPVALERVRAQAAERDRQSSADRLSKARWLWSRRKPIIGSLAETYLRDVRGYDRPLPATLGFLPARGKHGPAMIAAFGIAYEPEPGLLEIADIQVRGVHLTRLSPDGSGKAGTDADKITMATSIGYPIILAPPNDVLGLAITEGIENALSVHDATGLGVWAAGCASRLPALANAVPNYIEAITIYSDADTAGQAGAVALAEALIARGFADVRIEGLAS